MIKDIFDYVISLLKSRLFPLIMVFVLIVVVLINRLFSLQIIKGASYVTDLTDSIQKNMSVAATRGRIYDRNGVLLAYNALAYAVKISDSGTYSDKDGMKATDIKNAFLISVAFIPILKMQLSIMPSTVLLKLSKKRATSIQQILKSAMPVTECTNLMYPILPCCVLKEMFTALLP